MMRAGSFSRFTSIGSSHIRRMSSLVEVNKDEGTSVATLLLNRPPANTISLEFIAEIRDSLRKLEADESVRGIILSSKNPKIFCAGLDFDELVDPDPERLHQFWTDFQLLNQEIFLSRLATVAAMSGHAPAGGTVLALSCDARVLMAGGPRTGLNETALGLNPPWWICDLLDRAVGSTLAEKMLMRGTLVDATQALNIGLVDEAPENDSEFEDAVSRQMKALLSVPDFARNATKLERREKLSTEMKARTSEGSDWFVERITHPLIQKPIQAYVKSLKR